MESCLSVVIPVFNEKATIEKSLAAVLAQASVREVVIVDDCSTDGTVEVLEKMVMMDTRVRLHRHLTNQGKGAAVRTGFQNVTSLYTLIQDADLEYDPREYDKLLQPLLDGDADVVLGSRFIGGSSHRVLYFWHSVGNKFLTLLSNMATNLNLTDMECCYKVFKTELLKRFQIEEKRFGIEPEIVAKLSRLGVRIYEVAVSYRGRTYEEGKKITWKDGVQALLCIIKYRLR
jgi:glycosyltransferase involved in cell wall biosynthesis